jgi:hypothetical protein
VWLLTLSYVPQNDHYPGSHTSGIPFVTAIPSVLHCFTVVLFGAGPWADGDCGDKGRVQISPVPSGGAPPPHGEGPQPNTVPHEAVGNRSSARKIKVLVSCRSSRFLSFR